jgi:hypothetical protein
VAPAHDDRHEPIEGFQVELGTPRRLPKPHTLVGRVAVLDIAFSSESGGRRSGFERTTLRFIEGLGERLRAWIDHHDSAHHVRFAGDPRFVLATKAEHGACPEMITPELTTRLGPVETLVCHTDFDGLASAAKWMRAGVEPYSGCDADARAVDTRCGVPGPHALRIDRALRARPRDEALRRLVVAHLASGLSDEARWLPIDEAGSELEPLEAAARRLAERYQRLSDELVMVDVTGAGPYDKTLLLLLGQERARMAAVIDDQTVTFAAPFDSGVDFVSRFGLSGGMPTMVSIHTTKLDQALAALGAQPRRS